jgi:tRNA-dihydrouridine synthase
MPSIQDLKNLINLFKKNISDYDEIIYKTLIEFRKHLFCYVKGMSDSKVFKSDIINAKNYSQLTESINIFFQID